MVQIFIEYAGNIMFLSCWNFLWVGKSCVYLWISLHLIANKTSHYFEKNTYLDISHYKYPGRGGNG